MGLKVQQSIVFSSPAIMNGEKLQALIEGIATDGITLNVPWENISIPEKTDVTISFWDEHSTYEFTSKTLKPKTVDQTSLLISKPISLTRVINRSYKRVTINLKTDVSFVDDFNKEPCILIDISAGGASMQGQSIYKPNDLIKLTFHLPDGEFYEDLSAKVVWQKDLGGGLSYYGLQFENISNIRRQKLLNFTENTPS